MSLKSQRRLAADLLGGGLNRVWIDPEDIDRVQSAITRDEVKKLIREGSISLLPKTGVSRGRVRPGLVGERRQAAVRAARSLARRPGFSKYERSAAIYAGLETRDS